MKDILISSFDMEVGGVERSLISMLNNFDYENNNVDLMLYSHSGEFMNLLPKKTNLLKENKKYKTFRMSIIDILKNKEILIAITRLYSKFKSKLSKSEENGYKQMQYIWKYSLPFLPKIKKEYDVAISYLWPHYFIADKVCAKTKIAWIHTDYSKIDTNINLDLKMWNKFDYIVSISDEVTKSFVSKYPTLEKKIILIENITSPKFVEEMSIKNQDEIIKEDGFNILSVGRFSYAKGFDNAIKAMKIIKDSNINDIKWYLIGYGPDENMLKDLIKENSLEENFIILGKKTNPYPYMKACDLYVQPSRYEGKAVTVTEAQILSKAVMITNYTTAKSQINDKIDGHICENSIKDIAKDILYLYDNKNVRDKLSNNCKNTNYSNDYELKKLYEIIVEEK